MFKGPPFHEHEWYVEAYDSALICLFDPGLLYQMRGIW